MVTPYFTGQGRPYDERGWPTWECAVTELLTILLRDRSKISAVDEAPSRQSIHSIITPLCFLDEVADIVEVVVQIIRGDWHVNDRMIA